MNEKEFNEQLFPKDIFFSPSLIIDTFNHYVNQAESKTKSKHEALQYVLHHRNTKKLKEMWVAAVFVLGTEAMGSDKYWITPCDDNAPDVIAICHKPHPTIANSNRAEQLFIEITEWNSNSKEELSEIISKKTTRKKYPNCYQIVVHITGSVNFDMENIIIDSGSNEYGVWLLYSVESDDNLVTYRITRVTQVKTEVLINLEESVKIDRVRKYPPLLQRKKRKGMHLDISEKNISIPQLDD